MRYLIFFLIGMMFIASGCTQQGKYDEFARCVAASGAEIYAAWWCPHCREQKKDFGSSWKILDEMGAHIECSPGGTRVFSQYCLNQGIKATPTWRFGDGSEVRGRLPLELIAQKTGCELPS